MMPIVDNWDDKVAHLQPDDDLKQWLTKQAETLQANRLWLLAHMDDGVVWGRWEHGTLSTSNDIAPAVSPPLRLVTLQQLFFFDDLNEIRLWREEDGWCARRISGKNEPAWSQSEEYIDEAQVLWGTETEAFPDEVNGNSFTHVRERVANYGMDHVVPIPVTKAQLENRQLKLRVRHYFDYDPLTGEARIALSRLVGLEPEPQESEQ